MDPVASPCSSFIEWCNVWRGGRQRDCIPDAVVLELMGASCPSLPQRGDVFTVAVCIYLEEKLRGLGCRGFVRRTVANEQLESFGAGEYVPFLLVISFERRYFRAVNHCHW